MTDAGKVSDQLPSAYRFAFVGKTRNIPLNRSIDIKYSTFIKSRHRRGSKKLRNTGDPKFGQGQSFDTALKIAVSETFRPNDPPIDRDGDGKTGNVLLLHRRGNDRSRLLYFVPMIRSLSSDGDPA